MQLQEHQTKQLLREHGINVPNGCVVTSEDEYEAACQQLPEPIVIKPQTTPPTSPIPATNYAEVRQALMTTRNLLIEAMQPITLLMTLRIQIDYNSGKIVVRVANLQEDMVSEKQINAFLGIREYQARDMASDISLSRKHWGRFTMLLKCALNCYLENNMESLRIDQLGIRTNGEFVAQNATAQIDTYALAVEPSKSEIQHIVFDDAQIDIISNDTGTSLHLFDMLKDSDLASSVNYIHIGDDPTLENMVSALGVITQLTLVSIFCAPGSAQAIADTIVSTYQYHSSYPPIIVHLAGVDAVQGQSRIRGAQLPNVFAASTQQEALEWLVNMLELE